MSQNFELYRSLEIDRFPPLPGSLITFGASLSLLVEQFVSTVFVISRIKLANGKPKGELSFLMIF